MSDTNFSDGQSCEPQSITEERLGEILDERLDIEALTMMVEHMDYADQLSGKLASAFSEVRSQTGQLTQVVGSVQQEIRDLIMDVAMLKRALTSLGHVGVMERRKIERELVLELFPPTQPRPGTGVMANMARPSQPQKVDCENRLHLCKAACCRIFNVHLTPQEVLDNNHDWNPRQPYSIPKNRVGCTYLQSGGCACTIYASRPNTCSNYSCANDKRIWQDFENKVINPDLAKRLATLDVNTEPVCAESATIRPNQLASVAGGSQSLNSPMRTTATPSAMPDPPTSPQMPETPKVAPPNFDELRNLIVPKPAKKFVPSRKENGNGQPASSTDG